jgi:hypothetical protein
MTVSELTKGLGLTETGIRAFDDIDWKEHSLTKTRLGIVRMLACCEDMLKEKKSMSPDVF